KELYVMKGDEEDDGILCLKFIILKKKEKTNGINYDLNFKVILNLFDLIECKHLKICFYLTLLFKKFKNLRSMFFKEFKGIINKNCIQISK
ncbi:hypothetical protein RFI_36392, partial [Reticulomyxa filosa]